MKKRSKQLREAAKSMAYIYARGSTSLSNVIESFSDESLVSIYWALNFVAGLPDQDELSFRREVGAALDRNATTTQTTKPV